ncbi:MAG: 30S ribosomal protein S3 [Candidatus Diapherotrites archaeon]|uniref:30S ribosomal protein S3 n=1 Tax=Candidatus Iainarchaeum sp. TaxID=3101447 RepID=A0A2D6M0Q0_9ARCH|nr:30S ribosomal protein S3 [Candidatus Diapherotrites archaeon]
MIERVFIKQGMRQIEIEHYLKKELNRAGFTGLEIVKTPLVTRIVLQVTRPGLAIGKEGQNIKKLTGVLGNMFGVDNPQLEIQETPQSDLNSTAIVNKMASLLERGYSWRSVAFRTVRDVMGAGAQGIELVLSGKLAGKGGRKRKQRVAEGYMKKVGDQTSLVDYAKASAYPKAGAIGIKLRIIRPGVVFPDKIDIKEAIAKKQQAEEKTEEEKVGTVETAEEEKIEKKIAKKEKAGNKEETKKDEKKTAKKVEKKPVEKKEKKVKEEENPKKEKKDKTEKKEEVKDDKANKNDEAKEAKIEEKKAKGEKEKKKE